MRRFTATPILAGVVAIGALSATGCGDLNRSATLGLRPTSVEVSGATVAAALAQQLARRGFPAARVTCARTIIVNVGTYTSCELHGAGPHGTVHFHFRSAGREIEPGSVKVS
jgi:hypothetical protein